MKPLTIFCLLFSLARILSGQSIDSDFAPQFTRPGETYDVEVQNDQKYLVAGNFTFYGSKLVNSFVRLHPDGQLDSSFQYDPRIISRPADFKIQDDGKIIISGYFLNRSREYLGNLLRLLPNGQLDPTFQVVKDSSRFYFKVEILPNKKLFVAYSQRTYFENSNYSYGLRLFDEDGLEDPFFRKIDFEPDLSGEQYRTLADIGFRSSNELIAMGSGLTIDTFNQIGLRFDSMGVVDADFNPVFEIKGGNKVNDFDVFPNGNIGVISGNLNDHFLFDSLGNFLSSIYTSTDYNLIKGTEDGNILLLGGSFSFFGLDGRNDWYLINGLPGVGPSDFAFDSTGVIIVGRFDEYQGTPTTGIIRLDMQGANLSFDDNFQTNLFSPATVQSLVQQDDGKIIAAGFFDYVNGQPIPHLVRLFPDGSIDSTFDLSNTNSLSRINEIRSLSDGRLVVGGSLLGQYTDVNIVGLDILDKDGKYLMDLPFDFQGKVGGVGLLEVDSKDYIYAAEGITIRSNDGAKQSIFRYKINSNNEIEVIDYDDLFFDDMRTVNGFHIQKDDKVLFRGTDIQYNGGAPTVVVRAEPNGERDPGFQNDILKDLFPTAMLSVDTNTTFIALASGNFYRLFPDGTTDLDFSNDFSRTRYSNYKIDLLKELPNGHIFVEGNFDMHKNISVPSGRIIMDKNGNFIQELLPELRSLFITDLLVKDSTTIYLSGGFLMPNGAASLVRVNLEQIISSTNKISKTELKLYPNPARSDQIFLELEPLDFSRTLNYSIYKVGSGVSIKNGILQADSRMKIPVSELSNGIYLLHLYNNKWNRVTKFVRIRN